MDDRTLLKPDRNCWRLVHANRAAFLIDGQAYFSALRAALEQARKSILIVGWDIDSKIWLVRDDLPHEHPVQLGEFLNALVTERQGLEAHVLIWDFAMIYALERELLPLYKLRWQSHHHLHFHMDDEHPIGASHHQKIVVVDDAVAFVGGFDLTKRRWDTSEHRPEDPRRRDPDGDTYTPFHDVQMIVDGKAAAALGELARKRWQRATAKSIQPPAVDDQIDPWPGYLQPDLKDVEIAIARTEPAHAGNPEVREVERLYLDAIACAQDTIYIENQYLTSVTVGQALVARLMDDQGPEIVLILPYKSSGWLEHTTMDVLRARLLRKLRDADRHGRLRIYYPDVSGLGEQCINLHAKILIVDDGLVRVGSSNLSNRSMGLDTECDLAIEANGHQHIEKAILDFRNRLLGEHLGTEPATISQTATKTGSLIQAIETLRHQHDRTLKDLNGEVPASLDETVPDSSIIDPESPLDPDRLTDALVPEEERKPAGRRLLSRVGIIVAVLALAAAWRWTPLGEWLDVGTLTAWVIGLQDSPLGGIVAIGGFLIGSLIAFPVTLLILVTALVFGPVLGFVYSLVGTLLGAILTYGIGHLLGRNTLRRLGGSRINNLSRWLAHRGIITMLTVRLLPVAPFTIINLVAGASHISFRDYALGTLLGMTPGMLALTIFADSVQNAVQDPQPANFALLAGVIALIIVGAFTIRRWLKRRTKTKRSVSREAHEYQQ